VTPKKEAPAAAAGEVVEVLDVARPGVANASVERDAAG
jgi:hypothetical protein